MFLDDLKIATFEKVGSATTSTYFNFSDHLNSSSVTTDNQGNITNLNDYLPYGSNRVNVQLGSFNPSYKFTDQESDSESGLYYYGARYYDQRIGKFVQQDPMSLYLYDDGQLKEKVNRTQSDILVNPQNLNTYAYALNNPIAFVDADGQISFRAMVTAPFNFFRSVGSVMTRAVDSYMAYQAQENMRQTQLAYQKYGELSEKQQAFYQSKENYANYELGNQRAIDLVMGMSGEGLVNLSKNAAINIGKDFAAKSGAINEKLMNTWAAKLEKIEPEKVIKQAEKSINSWAKGISEHLTKIDLAKKMGGYTSSMEKEMKAWADSIKTLEEFINNIK